MENFSSSSSEINLTCINVKMAYQFIHYVIITPYTCYATPINRDQFLWCDWYPSSFSVSSEDLLHLNPLNPGEKHTGLFRIGHLVIMCITFMNDYFIVY